MREDGDVGEVRSREVVDEREGGVCDDGVHPIEVLGLVDGPEGGSEVPGGEGGSGEVLERAAEAGDRFCWGGGEWECAESGREDWPEVLVEGGEEMVFGVGGLVRFSGRWGGWKGARGAGGRGVEGGDTVVGDRDDGGRDGSDTGGEVGEVEGDSALSEGGVPWRGDENGVA